MGLTMIMASEFQRNKANTVSGSALASCLYFMAYYTLLSPYPLLTPSTSQIL